MSAIRPRHRRVLQPRMRAATHARMVPLRDRSPTAYLRARSRSEPEHFRPPGGFGSQALGSRPPTNSAAARANATETIDRETGTRKDPGRLRRRPRLAGCASQDGDPAITTMRRRVHARRSAGRYPQIPSLPATTLATHSGAQRSRYDRLLPSSPVGTTCDARECTVEPPRLGTELLCKHRIGSIVSQATLSRWAIDTTRQPDRLKLAQRDRNCCAPLPRLFAAFAPS